jgi:predicted RNase H-like nuclease (RuvC/YqgF family)
MDNVQEEIRKREAEIRDLQGYIAELAQKIQNYNGEYRDFDSDINIINKWTREMIEYEGNIRKLNGEISKLRGA